MSAKAAARIWLLAGLLALAACSPSQGVALGDAPTATPSAEERGRRLFGDVCAVCHGSGGEGGANDLNAPPLNAQGKTRLYSDEQLEAIIRQGGRIMPAYGEQWPETDVQDVVQFLRSIGGGGAPTQDAQP